MTNSQDSKNEMPLSERLYVIFCVIFAAIVITNNLIYQKFIAIPLPMHVLEISVGAILYPFTFFITDSISEIYGYERARFCIRMSIVISMVALLIVAGFSYIPATSWSKIDEATYKNIFGLCWISLLGSVIASYVSQTIDASLYLWMRKVTGYKYLWVMNISSAVAIFVDTFIVVSFVVLFGIVPGEKMLLLTIDSYIFKILVTACSTPLFYYLIGAMRRRIHLGAS